MLALQDPLDPDNETAGNKFIAQMEQVFTVIFTVEVQQTRPRALPSPQAPNSPSGCCFRLS